LLRLEAAETAVAKAEKETDTVRVTLIGVNDDLVAAQEAKKQAEAETHRLRMDLEAGIDRIKSLEKELSQQGTAVQDEITRLEQGTQESASEKDGLVATLRQQIASLEADRADMQRMLEDANRATLSLERNNTLASADNEEAADKIHTLERELANMVNRQLFEAQGWEEEKAHLEAHASQIEATLKGHLATIARLQKDRDSESNRVEMAVSEGAQQNSILAEKVSELEAELANQAAHFDTQAQAMQAKMDALEEEVEDVTAAYNTEVSSYREKESSLLKRCTQLEAALKMKEETAGAAQDRVAQLEDELVARSRHASAALDAMTQERDGLKAQQERERERETQAHLAEGGPHAELMERLRTANREKDALQMRLDTDTAIADERLGMLSRELKAQQTWMQTRLEEVRAEGEAEREREFTERTAKEAQERQQEKAKLEAKLEEVSTHFAAYKRAKDMETGILRRQLEGYQAVPPSNRERDADGRRSQSMNRSSTAPVGGRVGGRSIYVPRESYAAPGERDSEEEREREGQSSRPHSSNYAEREREGEREGEGVEVESEGERERGMSREGSRSRLSRPPSSASGTVMAREPSRQDLKNMAPRPPTVPGPIARARSRPSTGLAPTQQQLAQLVSQSQSYNAPTRSTSRPGVSRVASAVGARAGTPFSERSLTPSVISSTASSDVSVFPDLVTLDVVPGPVMIHFNEDTRMDAVKVECDLLHAVVDAARHNVTQYVAYSEEELRPRSLLKKASRAVEKLATWAIKDASIRPLIFREQIIPALLEIACAQDSPLTAIFNENTLPFQAPSPKSRVSKVFFYMKRNALVLLAIACSDSECVSAVLDADILDILVAEFLPPPGPESADTDRPRLTPPADIGLVSSVRAAVQIMASLAR
ncbi:hypothetical protein KIPB_005892, partial [Kipferlia bialata]